MRDRGCLLGLALCCASAALVVGVLMFAPAAVLAVALRAAVLAGCVVALVTIARGR
jgi:hypothetical protein